MPWWSIDRTVNIIRAPGRFVKPDESETGQVRDARPIDLADGLRYPFY
jgi:hypothetical protein